EPTEGDAGAPSRRPAAPGVVVAGAGRDLCDLAEPGQHLLAADVARVQDVVDVPEGVEHLGPEQAMGIGDDADAHCCSIRQPMELLCKTPPGWIALALER